MNKNCFGILTVFFSFLFFASCASKKEVSSLLSGRWNIIEVNGEKITGEKSPFIEFDTVAKRLHGNAGCNNFMGGYELDAANTSAFKILQVGATMMACPDMETEDKVLKSLDKVAAIRETASGIQLLDKSGVVVFLLNKTKKAMLAYSGLEGEWALVELNGSRYQNTDYKPFVVFDIAGKRFSGNAGCNRMSGQLEYDEGQPGLLTFGKAMTTRMACPALDTEQEFLTAMQNVVRFEAVPADSPVTQVAFYDAGNTRQFVLKKK